MTRRRMFVPTFDVEGPIRRPRRSLRRRAFEFALLVLVLWLSTRAFGALLEWILSKI